MRIQITAFSIVVFCLFVEFVSLAQAPELVWAKSVGGTGIEFGHGIVTDASGNVYVVGRYEGTADFDPGPGTFNLTSVVQNDIFILKVDASGNFVWAKSMGGTNIDDQGLSIALDDSGNIYTTGHFGNTVDFDPGAGTFNLTSQGSFDVFISKLDASGNFVWARSIGGTDMDIGYAIVADASGVYTTGFFSETVDFDPGAGIENITSVGPGTNDAFIVKLDSDGNFDWARSVGGNANGDAGYGITLDASSNVYITGKFESTADFNLGTGVNTLTATGLEDIFILKLDASGGFEWVAGIGAEDDDSGLSIDVDASGNVYTTGYYTGSTADFDPGAGVEGLPHVSAEDIFVLKLTTDGNFVWAKSMGGDGDENGKSLKTDDAGNVYTTGFYEQTTDFDPGSGTSELTSASYDIFISKLDAAGNFVQAASMGGGSLDQGRSVTVDAADNIYITGSYLETADFDPDPDAEFNVTYAGNAPLNSDAFLLKLGASETPNNPGELIVFNAVSANGDELNNILLIQNIETSPDTQENTVTVYNRWGDIVFEISDYNNEDRVFSGRNKNDKELPSGTYYYKIEFSSGRKTQAGYLSVKR